MERLTLMNAHEQRDTPCPICHQQSYTSRKCGANGFGLAFPDSPFWRRFLAIDSIPVRRCNTCGNLQLFTAIENER